MLNAPIMPAGEQSKSFPLSPEKRQHKRPNLCRVVLFFGAAILVLLRVRYGASNIPDTAYDIFVVARNLVQGNGLIFNIGDRFLAITSPLFAVLMGALGFVIGTQHLPWIAVLLNTLADLGSFYVIYRWIAKAAGSPWLGTVCAIIFALDQKVIEFSSGGNDTSLYILLLLCALRAFQERRELRLGIFAGLASIYRPEGLMVAAVLLPFSAWRDRRWPGLATRIIAGILLTYYLVLICYYDSPIPQTMLGVWNLPNPHGGFGRWHIVILHGGQLAMALYGRFLWWGWHRWVWNSLPEAIFQLGLFSFQAILYGWAIWKLSRNDLSLTAAAAYLFIHIIAFCLSDVRMTQGKYEVPLEPLWSVGLVGAWWFLAGERRPWAILWGPFLIASQIAHIALAGSPDAQWLLADHRDKGAEQTARKACQVVQEHGIRPTDTVMSSFIYLPRWQLDARAFDLFGINYPEALYYKVRNKSDFPRGTPFINPALVMDVRPKYLIIFHLPVIYYQRDPRFRCTYNLLWRAPAPLSYYARLPAPDGLSVPIWLEIYKRQDGGDDRKQMHHCQENFSRKRHRPNFALAL